jgi:hypothetical protein
VCVGVGVCVCAVSAGHTADGLLQHLHYQHPHTAPPLTVELYARRHTGVQRQRIVRATPCCTACTARWVHHRPPDATRFHLAERRK